MATSPDDGYDDGDNDQPSIGGEPFAPREPQPFYPRDQHQQQPQPAAPATQQQRPQQQPKASSRARRIISSQSRIPNRRTKEDVERLPSFITGGQPQQQSPQQGRQWSERPRPNGYDGSPDRFPLHRRRRRHRRGPRDHAARRRRRAMRRWPSDERPPSKLIERRRIGAARRSAAARRLGQPDQEPDRHDDDGAEQEIPPQPAHDIEAHSPDMTISSRDQLDDIPRIEPNRGEDHADQDRQQDQAPNDRQRRAAEEAVNDLMAAISWAMESPDRVS